jgi:hypothetical protein
MKNNKIKKINENSKIFSEISLPDYRGNYRQYMQSFVNRLKTFGFELTFLQDVYESRGLPFWYDRFDYATTVAEIKMSDRITLEVYAVSSDFSLEDSYGEVVARNAEELEHLNIYTDEDLYEYRDDEKNVFVYYEINSYFNILVYDNLSKFSEEISVIDMDIDTPQYLDEVFSVEYLKKIFNIYMEDYAPKRTKKIVEDKAGIKRFSDKFGDDLSSKFFNLKPRLKAPENDISFWMKKTKEELDSFLLQVEKTKTVKQKEEEIRKGSTVLYKDPKWEVIEIHTLEASRKYGYGTKWCISGQDCSTEDMWNKYKKTMPNFPEDSSSLIFFMHKESEEKYAVLYNRDNHAYLIWTENDIPVMFIPDAPEVKGMKYLGNLPFSLRRKISKTLGIPLKNIIKVKPSKSSMYPGDYLEKYFVVYRDEEGTKKTAGVFRNPETEEFDYF